MSRVLLVEDEPLLTMYYGQMFEEAGIQTTLAYRGREAIDCYGREKFDAVVLDLGLPDVSGFEVIKALRRQNSKLPVFIMSGMSDSRSLEKSRKLEVNGYFVKPFQPESLIIQVVALLK